MTTREAIGEITKALLAVAKEVNELTQEIIKLNERIEDATTTCVRRRES